MDEKILYLDCASGISGDMTVGALLDLGASREKLVRALDSLGVSGYHLHFGRTKKCGIDAYDFDVHLEEEEHHHDHEHSHDEHNHSHDEHDHSHDEYDHEHHHDHEHTHDHEHHHAHEHTHEHEHSHDHAHTHDHMHPHVHRNIHDIFEIIDRLDASDRVKNLARRMFEIVAGAESKAHGIPVSEVHFHEVGAIDSIVDVISAAFCLEDLGIHRVVVSPLSEGHGFARCQHGLMPVPVPATANIAAAQGLELTLRDVEGEMVTPTGAAIAAALPKKYQIEKIGIGAGNKDFAHANILRAMLLTDKTVEVETGKDGHDESSMWVMEANLDDCTGEALGYAMEVLLEAGARDVWYTPAYMKKNRPAYVLHVLTTAEKREELEQLVFSCTTTIGVRRYPVERTILPREVKEIQTRYGAAKVKICKRGGVDTCYPEYESVRAICRETGKRFMEVFHGVMEDGSISLQ